MAPGTRFSTATQGEIQVCCSTLGTTRPSAQQTAQTVRAIRTTSAIQLTNKRMLFNYAVTQLQHFLICGRTTHSVLQSDQEDFLTSLITAVANKNGNITTRNPGAYSSQSQAGVEQAQIRQNYNRDIAMEHPLVPHKNRYAVHSNGRASHFNRWSREQHTPLCEFGVTVQHMLPAVKQFPKLGPRFYNGI